MMARISESCVVTIGMTRFRVAFFTASMAMKFSGSLMARHTSSGEVRTGTTLYWRATFLLITRLSSGSRSIAERSTNSTPSCICSASMRPASVMTPSAMSSSPRRRFVSFCCLSACPSWSSVMRPASISTSPNRLYAIYDPILFTVMAVSAATSSPDAMVMRKLQVSLSALYESSASLGARPSRAGTICDRPSS